jgi:hypothetical protein
MVYLPCLCCRCATGLFVAPSGLHAAAASACASPCTGRYSGVGSETCSPCAAGKYGNVSGLTVPQCSGNCSAGYVCPLASTAAADVANACPPGSWSAAGATACSLCLGGYFGATAAATQPQCSGPCTATPGFACGVGSTSANGTECGRGFYGTGGAAVCRTCPSGRFGASARMTNDTCSGLCPPGSYSDAGATECSVCPAGAVCAAAGTSDPPLCPYGFACGDGTYNLGAARCEVGRWCPTGSSNASVMPCLVNLTTSAWSDFNGDGRLDVVAAWAGRGSAVPVLWTAAADGPGSCNDVEQRMPGTAGARWQQVFSVELDGRCARCLDCVSARVSVRSLCGTLCLLVVFVCAACFLCWCLCLLAVLVSVPCLLCWYLCCVCAGLPSYSRAQVRGSVAAGLVKTSSRWT